MKRFFTYLAFLLLATTGCAQVKNAPVASQADSGSATFHFKQEQTFMGNYNGIEVDAIGNLYLLNDGQLKKISAAGDSMAVFNDVKRFGVPTALDVANPFKALLYYRPYATIVLLDNMLSNRGVVNLRKSGIFTAKATGVSYDNKIWVFDEQDFKLKKLDEEGKLLFESNDLRQVASITPQPEGLWDHEGTVYLYDPQLGFVLLDYYGAYLKLLPFKGWHSVSISKNMLYGFRDKKLFSYQLNSLQLKEYDLPAVFEGAEAVRAAGGRVYLQKKDRIDVLRVL